MARLKNLWIERASCVGIEPEIWFDHDTHSPGHQMALRICTGCEVRRPCYETAIRNREHFGIWGGVDFTTLDRRRRKAPVNF